ncbi:MAG: DMT family transporter [Albidovulum sp.]|nr:DMT family transporter [Albidovulum sp.]
MPISTPELRIEDRANLVAFGCMAVVSALTAVDATIVRYLAGDVHPFVIGFFRSAFGLCAIFPLLAVRRNTVFQSNYCFLHILRSGLRLAALASVYAAFQTTELTDAMAIIFTGPIFLVLGAWIFLGEKLGVGRVAAVAIGFSGTIIVIQPGGSAPISIGALYALGGAFLIAISQLMLKRMSSRDDTDTLVAWNLVSTVPIAAIPAAIFWTRVEPEILALLALQGILGVVCMLCVTKAFGLADASRLAPINYARLPLVAILAYWCFGEVADATTWLGAAVIAGSSLIAIGGSRLQRFARFGHGS